MDPHTPFELDEDGIDRRGFLSCMAWAGTGLIFTMKGGVLNSHSLGDFIAGGERALADLHAASFTFVQISDSHIGFSKEANKDVAGTMRLAIDRINAAKASPDLLLHTGDLSHLSKPDEFDAVDQILKPVAASQRLFVPGEHDVFADNGKAYRERYGKHAEGDGWYSFDHKGVHFIGLVNVLNLKASGLGHLGENQLAWLADDLRGKATSTPIVVFAHVPLWTVYAAWGWGTDDAARALSLLKDFGSVTVLNGHIHQTMQKVEGNVTFHTAMSTAFPQPKPGSAPAPGPMTVPADRLHSVLGVRSVRVTRGSNRLAIVDSTLADPVADAGHSVSISSFTFRPTPLAIRTGGQVTWTNRDEAPHTVVDTHGRFRSPALDTGESWTHRFELEGTYDYFCSIHTHMRGKLLVR
ncbi:MAG: metallophosphoesterase [Fimbriimonadaceae bacterium]